LLPLKGTFQPLEKLPPTHDLPTPHYYTSSSEVVHIYLKLRQGFVIQVWGISEFYLLAAASWGASLLLGSLEDEEHPCQSILSAWLSSLQ